MYVCIIRMYVCMYIIKVDKRFDACPPHEDPGVVACAEMYGYFKKYRHLILKVSTY